MDYIQEKENPSPMPIMSVDEARKVMWLHNNYRPLGELYDEGYLNRSRLEWAAQKAYDPKLKQATKVLLDWSLQPANKSTPKNIFPHADQIIDNGLQTNISIEKARSTPWPLPPYKGQPMGPLVETKQLSLKDLGYAIENAWDERVRRAAMALSLERMKQKLKEPPPYAGFVHMVTWGRSYSEREQLRLSLIEGAFLGAVMMGLVILLIYDLIKQQPHFEKIVQSLSTPVGILSLVIALVLMVSAIWLFLFAIGRVVGRWDQQMDNHRLGQEGEERAVETILQSLDGNWHLFRNVVLPGRNKGDLDAVLVGPLGVWVLEIKNLNGEYRNIGDLWEYRKGYRWVPAKVNPSRQAENNAIRLANFLKADNIKQWVTSAVVWANQENLPTIQNPATAVWSLDRLPDELGNLLRDQSIFNTNQEKIVRKLTQLCQQH